MRLNEMQEAKASVRRQIRRHILRRALLWAFVAVGAWVFLSLMGSFFRVVTPSPCVQWGEEGLCIERAMDEDRCLLRYQIDSVLYTRWFCELPRAEEE